MVNYHFRLNSKSREPGLATIREVSPVFGSRGGALGYFLGGYVPPGTPNWHPVLKKFLLKLIPRSRYGPISFTPF